MRVLYLADTYRPARTACANRTAVLVEALQDAGHDVRVLASTDSLIGVPEGYEISECVTLFDTFPLVDKTLVNRLRNNFKRKRARLVLDVRDIWPDVAYEMGSFAPGSLYGRFFERVARKAYAAADLVVSVSPGKVEKLRRRVPNGKVVLVPNGIDEAFLGNLEDPDLAERLRLDDGPVCAYVGNIGLAQGLGTLLGIAKARPSVRFLLFGDGADRAKLEARANDDGIGNVEFCGKVDARGVYTVLKHAAVSYVPLVSSRLRDSIPTKMYEALACGCPVLLAAEGDAADLLDECGLGAHAAPEDPVALLAAFDRLMERPFSDAERAAASARQRFAKAFAEEIGELEGRHV